MGGNNSVPVVTKRDEKKEVAHDPSRHNPQKDADANESKPHGNQDVYTFHFNDALRRYINNHRTPIATSLASVSSTLVAYPLDFVRARMQAYNTRFVPTLVDAYKHEGIRAVYKGCITPIYSIALVRIFSFSTYNKTKDYYDKFSQRHFGVSPLAMANARGQYPNKHTMACFLLSGVVGGMIIPWPAAPFELMKLQTQLAGKMKRDNPGRTTSTNHVKTGTWGPAYRMVRERGLFSLWKGVWFHLARDTIGTAIYFSVYEAAKQTIATAQGLDPTDLRASTFAGGLSGLLSWIFIYPIDVKKTQYQKRFLSHEIIKETAKINFFKASGYHGLGISLLRSCVVNALFFPAYERLTRALTASGLHGNVPVNPDNDVH